MLRTTAWLRSAARPTRAVNLREAAFLPSTTASSLRSSLTTGVLALGLGFGVYVLTKRKADEVPAEVRRAIAEGTQLMDEGSPLTAAAKYQYAVDELIKRDSNPVLVLDLLLRLADAQAACKQFALARDNMRRCEHLAIQLEGKRLVDADSSTAAWVLPETLQKQSGLALVTKESVAHKHLVALTRRADMEEALGTHGVALSLLRSAQASALEHFRSSLMQSAFSSTVMPVVTATRARAATTKSQVLPPPAISRGRRQILTSIAGCYFNLAHLLAEQAEQAEEAGLETGSAVEAAALQEMLAGAFMAVVLIAAAARAAHKDLEGLMIANSGGGSSALSPLKRPAGADDAGGTAAAPTEQLLALPDDSPLVTGSGDNHGNKGRGSSPGFVPLSVLPLGLPSSLEHGHLLVSSSKDTDKDKGEQDATPSTSIKSRGRAKAAKVSNGGAASLHSSPVTLSCALSYGEMLEVCRRACEPAAFAVAGKLPPSNKAAAETLHEELEMLVGLLRASTNLWVTAAWRLHAHTMRGHDATDAAAAPAGRKA